MKVFADWGTSNLRAWLVDDSGRVLGRHRSDQGLLVAAKAGFIRVFDSVLAELGAATDTPALIFGMAGSRKGWLEVPYTSAPADAASIARCARRVTDRSNTWIMGGVSCGLDGPRPEVMRGEEVQTLGVLTQHPGARWVCLPGTHTKWVSTEAGRIKSFSTYMTGELFHWVTRQSIISTQIEGDAFDKEGFLHGLDLAKEPTALTNTLFQLRTRYLAGSIAAGQVHSVASGLLIGYELFAARSGIGSRVLICAAPALAQAYTIACGQVGLESATLDPEQAAIAGLLTLAPMIDHDAFP